MAGLRAALALIAAGALAAAVVSGGSPADPRTPAGLPGLPPPFLGTAVVGSGGLTAAIDAYGDVVDLRAPGPAGRAMIDNPAARQAAGGVPDDTGIVLRVRIGGGPALPLWRADSVSQRYLRGTNAVRTVARFGSTRVEVVYAASSSLLACLARSTKGRVAIESGEAGAWSRLRCNDGAARRTVRSAERSDRRWLSRARPLGAAAPAWARRMYRRSLLVLRGLTDRRTGAVAAGARDGWAYVWPRDAATAALAYAAAGYRPEARRVARFLLGLGLDAAARFDGGGAPLAGRAAQGDAIGWVATASQAAGIVDSTRHAAQILAGGQPIPWRNRADYWEGAPGNYLGNALATPFPDVSEFSRHIGRGNSDTSPPAGLLRELGEPDSGLDSAAAWGVRPFPHPDLYPAIRRSMEGLTAQGTRFGITPGEDWPGVDPWTAPTAWTAWSLAALSGHDRRGSAAAALRERRAALRLLGDLRRAATPAGDLPERVDAETGIPRSTTPLAWSHAFAILALRQLWPNH